jgi:hypothetical protein
MEIEYSGKDNDYITDEERQHLISGLHRLLVWVGEPLPETVNVDGKTVEVHETIWWCIHKKEFTEEEKNNFREIARLLEKKEKDYEGMLQTANLTHEEADKLYHEIASILRAITDIRECETGKVNLKEHNEDIKQRIDEAKRFMSFLKTVKKRT